MVAVGGAEEYASLLEKQFTPFKFMMLDGTGSYRFQSNKGEQSEIVAVCLPTKLMAVVPLPGYKEDDVLRPAICCLQDKGQPNPYLLMMKALLRLEDRV